MIDKAARQFLRDNLGFSVSDTDLKNNYTSGVSRNGVVVTELTHKLGAEGYVVLAPGSNGRVTRSDLDHCTDKHRGLGRRIVITAALYTPNAGFSWIRSTPIPQIAQEPMAKKGAVVPAAYVGGKA